MRRSIIIASALAALLGSMGVAHADQTSHKAFRAHGHDGVGNRARSYDHRAANDHRRDYDRRGHGAVVRRPLGHRVHDYGRRAYNDHRRGYGRTGHIVKIHRPPVHRVPVRRGYDGGRAHTRTFFGFGSYWGWGPQPRYYFYYGSGR
jgi:hypothetical protein